MQSSSWANLLWSPNSTFAHQNFQECVLKLTMGRVMTMLRLGMTAAVFALSFPFTASAWWDEGHMQIAAVAYERLSPEIREKADALIHLNPEYGNWVAGVPERLRPQYAFARAAVWADDIKSQIVGYTDEGDTANSPTASRNIGYVDSFKHLLALQGYPVFRGGND
ncbi:hypothetical protein C3Y94_028185 [Rhizobium ruizarguesonis]|uniref:S1/P1 nuclease n=1 Tax=Rhizobium ruizarguesonis TaxID=2081791 RepID=UPI00163AC077|nr:S1/P1 nuclease [Rhizobium ruizarguesonis]MBC2807010.1 hypothetical protein [Rhizobium ruizarguesonis]